MGVREREPAPLLRRGLEDARLRGRRAARLRAARPGGRARSPPARSSRGSPADSRSGSSSGSWKGRCRPSTARRPRAARRWRRRSRMATRSAARSSPTRSRSRSRSGTRPTGRSRSTWRAAPAASIDAVSDEEIVEGIQLLAETTGIFTETAGGVTTAVLRKLAERGDIGPDERVVLVHHRRGPEDARCGARCRETLRRSSRPRRASTRRSWRPPERVAGWP